jgi:hypothetical protein
MNVTDAASAAGGKRRGRRPKDAKRALLSVRINPELRRRMVAMAEENGRSITQQTELLLEQAVNGLGRASAPPSAEKPQNENTLASAFGNQIAGLLLVIGFVMFYAERHSLAWSRDVFQRTSRLPEVKTGKASMREMLNMDKFLTQSMPSGEHSWLLDDPYVFNQVAAAAKHVLDAIGPAGDPAPVQLPRGIDPSMAALLVMELGRISVDEVIEQLTADDDGTLSPAWVLIRDLLSEAVIARLRDRRAAELAGLREWGADG